MKIRVLVIVTILLLASFSYGEDRFFIEAKGNYFQPSEKAFQDMYGSGMSFGGEIGINIWKWIGIWAGGDYFTKKGKMTFTEEETKLRIIPIYGGIKFQLPKSRISPYAGFGVGYFQYKETNPIGEVEKGDIGYIGQIGCLFKIIGSLFFDVKGSYSYCKVKPVDIEADLGGLKGGIGLGFEF